MRFCVLFAGALDLMDEIGAAVAIPHSPQVWEEVHRIHHSHRARSRSRSRSRSAIHEVRGHLVRISMYIIKLNL